MRSVFTVRPTNSHGKLQLILSMAAWGVDWVWWVFIKLGWKGINSDPIAEILHSPRGSRNASWSSLAFSSTGYWIVHEQLEFEFMIEFSGYKLFCDVSSIAVKNVLLFLKGPFLILSLASLWSLSDDVWESQKAVGVCLQVLVSPEIVLYLAVCS